MHKRIFGFGYVAVALILLLLLTGCTTTNISSLDQLLQDLGIDADVEQMLEDAEVDLPDPRGAARDALEQLRNFRLELPSWLRLAFIVVGVVLMVAGGLVYRAAVAAPGFGLGMAFGTTVFSLAEELPQEVVLGMAAVLGLIGAGITLILHDLAVVVIGALTGGLLGFGILSAYAVEVSAIFVLIVLVCAVAGSVGLLMIARRQPALMGALLGAVLVSIGLVENVNLPIVVILALLGAWVQWVIQQVRGRRRARRAAQPQPAPAVAAAGPEPRRQIYTEPEKPEALPAPAVEPFASPAPVPQPVEPVSAMAAVFTRWTETGPIAIPIDKPVFNIGGDPAVCNLILPGLMQVHAVVMSGVREDGRPYHYLKNQVTPQETQVNGQPVQSAYLSDGDVIMLGEHELHFGAAIPKDAFDAGFNPTF